MSGSLGSVYDGVAIGPDRGPDLRWSVAVPASAVGDPGGVDVAVPFRLETEDGVVVDRAINPADAPGHIRVQVPTGVEFPVVLRLRGAGGLMDELAPGDLYLRVELGGPPVRLGGPAGRASLGAAGAAVALVLFALLATLCN